ncbi:MAG TPA: SGNH/GDSL hydrolase family protein [Polyangiaceae bacterium]|nr:SGNH/GDSL hydrolase family protein [Polyangiaceae bacterium]
MQSNIESRRSLMGQRGQLLKTLGCALLLVAEGCSSNSAEPRASGGSATSGGAANGSASGGSAGRAGGSAGLGSGGTSQAAAGTSAAGGKVSDGGMTGTGGSAPGSGGAAGGAQGGGGAGGGVAGGGAPGGATAGGTNAGGTPNTGGKASGGAGAAAASGGQGGAGSTSAGGTSAGGTTGSGGGGASYCPTTAGTPCNIMPIGDSITEGCCTAPMGGYRIELYHQALTNKKNITFVGTLTNGPGMVDGQAFPQRHEGHGGWKISQIAGVVDKAISSSHPHVVLLKIGTNDINGNDNIANAPMRLANLIDQICKDAPDALLVVSAIIPTTNDGTNNNVRNYNTAIKQKAEAAAAAGKHVVFVDNYQAFAQNSNYKTALMADGLHPNTAGYAVLGDSFYKVISSYLPAK